MTTETKTTRLRENWDSDQVSSELLDLVNKRLGLRNKSAVMRLAIADYATKILGAEAVEKARDKVK